MTGSGPARVFESEDRAEPRRLGGLLEKYAATGGPANKGAVTRSVKVDGPLDE